MTTYSAHFFDNCLVSTKRKERPHIGKQSNVCPFCDVSRDLEHIYEEVWAQDELCAIIAANKYPIVSPDVEPYGYHDVVIDTAHHNEHPKDFSALHWQKLLEGLHSRWETLSKDPRIHFIQIFKNYGTLAGASIYHSHWQIVALEQIPMGMIEQYKKYYPVEGTCFLCSAESREHAYLLAETSHWYVIVPPEPRMNYEVWIVPKRHIRHYGELQSEELKELGVWMKKVLEAYEGLMPNYDFNICMMGSDLDDEWLYHFHVKIMIRIGHIAGFELATQCYMHVADPSIYAKALKQLLGEK